MSRRGQNTKPGRRTAEERVIDPGKQRAIAEAPALIERALAKGLATRPVKREDVK
jgi:hypothetical protein